jgi:hypothetical protein
MNEWRKSSRRLKRSGEALENEKDELKNYSPKPQLLFLSAFSQRKD